MLRFDVLSIFPEMFVSPFECSLLQKAREKGLIEVVIHDIRQYAEDKHHMTDDAPYGGGGGMVMKVEPIDRALTALELPEATPVILTSSTQAALDNHYGRSKRAAEDAVFAYAWQTGAQGYVYRMPNVFGKW